MEGLLSLLTREMDACQIRTRYDLATEGGGVPAEREEVGCYVTRLGNPRPYGGNDVDIFYTLCCYTTGKVRSSVVPVCAHTRFADMQSAFP